MKMITDKKRINEILDRGVVFQILPSKEALIEKLVAGDRLKIYIGADPTSSALHLSHAKNYMFLEELRQLGHEVIVLFGDFTARIGDPSDRTEARKQLTEKEVKENVKDWLKQIKPLLNFGDKKNPPKVLYNSKWLAKLCLKDVISLASNFTVQQMLERDMFQDRMKDQLPIHLHEFLYPLMQGYDSVAMNVDTELCGTDQTFNALVGRTLVKRLKSKDKFVIIVNLMENPKTGELMSKSKGTGVFLSSPANEMYGAILAQPDEMTKVLFINCTRVPLAEINSILKGAPKKAKMRAAFEIVKKIYGEVAAKKAENNFEKLFVNKELAGEIPELKLKEKKTTAIDLVIHSGVAKSKSEARRLVEQGAVEINGESKKGVYEVIELKGGETLKIGKKNFFRIKII
ncbi:MAG: tyrosine--tRNA ligase [Candidatus Liptonbacteria bacterium RIFCSPLOWO2_01_FULL_45_15]|uniref:Tyrosine--tRNA ligase n=1 Tax=Candidatus Liptonbacteria bacterium RIFCSPLOWO2_01_FULL_45_15 TaxID=1798649 RepID=A0A1G2CG04_9BACT|nr:MAG: tyrosine--tRNA ligase [Candidatus Liptonbacteria bacterium RIFCSPLOWO2_01_FULL_45_15]